MSVVQTLIGNIKGPRGLTGPQGETGATGDAATIEVGSVTTVPYGQNARVVNSGTSGAAVFDFTIPQGRPGEQTTKIDALTIDSMTEPSASFPVPAIGDNGSTLFGKITKWFSDMSALVATKLSISNVANNLTTSTSGYALDARQGKELNDHTPMNTVTILSSAAGLTRSNIALLPTGCYIVQCADTSAAADFPVVSAYGVIFIYGSANNYHHAIFTDGNNMWKCAFNGSTVNTAWQAVKTGYIDVNLTVSTVGGVIQVNSASNNVLNYVKFINGYVVDTNNIEVRFHTYQNLIYAKLYNVADGSDAAEGTYKVRCYYLP